MCLKDKFKLKSKLVRKSFCGKFGTDQRAESLLDAQTDFKKQNKVLNSMYHLIHPGQGRMC